MKISTSRILAMSLAVLGMVAIIISMVNESPGTNYPLMIGLLLVAAANLLNAYSAGKRK